MPLTTYCPHAGCGAAASYTAVKPTKCPRCNKAYADAFKTPPGTTPILVAATPVARAVYEPEPPRLTLSQLRARQEEIKSRAEMKDEDIEEDGLPVLDGTIPDVDPLTAVREARALAKVIQSQGGMLELGVDAGDGPIRAGDYIQIVNTPRATKAKRSRKRTK